MIKGERRHSPAPINMLEELSTAPNVGASIKKKQFRLYEMCYDYLIKNFNNFSDANKLKVSLTLANRMAPQQVDATHAVTKMETIKLGDQPQELNLGNRVTQHIEHSN